MVRPAAFGYNPQTAESNAFQKRVNLSDEEIQRTALKEFDQMVKELRDLGIDVNVLEDTDEFHTPDSVFPNNWFSTHPGGRFCLYPMEAEARRFERRLAKLKEFQDEIDQSETFDLTGFENEEKFLEGTGSLILDHRNKVAYACLSSRTNEDVLNIWAEKLEFRIIEFHAYDEQRIPIYHTNVMMCLGDRFAVICLQSVADENEKANLIENLEKTDKEIVEISFDQMNNFAGNMLLLRNADGKKFLVMSERARRSLDKTQIEKLESHALIASFDIETIEDCGGGSVRCMIAEIFDGA